MIRLSKCKTDLLSPPCLNPLRKTNMSKVHQISYSERAQAHKNPAAKKLLETMERKQSNLCLSIDVTNKADLLRIVDAVGPQLCLLKVGFDENIINYHPHLFKNSILTSAGVDAH